MPPPSVPVHAEAPPGRQETAGRKAFPPGSQAAAAGASGKVFLAAPLIPASRIEARALAASGNNASPPLPPAWRPVLSRSPAPFPGNGAGSRRRPPTSGGPPPLRTAVITKASGCPAPTAKRGSGGCRAVRETLASWRPGRTLARKPPAAAPAVIAVWGGRERPCAAPPPDKAGFPVPGGGTNLPIALSVQRRKRDRARRCGQPASRLPRPFPSIWRIRSHAVVSRQTHLGRPMPSL
jgi:hypothetical protein